MFWRNSYKFGAYIEQLGHLNNNLVPSMISRHDRITCGKDSAKLAQKYRRN